MPWTAAASSDESRKLAPRIRISRLERSGAMSPIGKFETSRNVRSLVAIGKSRSDTDIAKSTRLTQSGPSACCISIVSHRAEDDLIPAKKVRVLVASGLQFRREARHPFLVLRQPVSDLPPRRLGTGEHMQLRPHAGIIVEQSGRNTHRSEISGFTWRG
jgi:hypothetical protein